MFVSCVCSVFGRKRPLIRAYHSFRGVLSSMCVCVCVCVRVRLIVRNLCFVLGVAAPSVPWPPHSRGF